MENICKGNFKKSGFEKNVDLHPLFFVFDFLAFQPTIMIPTDKID